MSKQGIKISMILVGIISGLIVILGIANDFTYDRLITFPFVQIARALRNLSLRGGLENVIALILFVGIGLLPMVVLIKRVLMKKVGNEDFILGLLSVLIYVSLYYMINPGYLDSFGAGSLAVKQSSMMFTSMIYLTLMSYLILRLLKRFVLGESIHLLGYLKAILIVNSLIMVAALCGFLPWNVMLEINQVRVGNTMEGIVFQGTDLFIALRALLEGVPIIFSIWIMQLGIKLLEDMKIEQFSEDVVETIRKIEKASYKAIVITTVLTLLLNLGQLIFSSSLLSTYFNIEIPITSIMLLLIVMLLAKYFADSQHLKDEMDLFV